MFDFAEIRKLWDRLRSELNAPPDPSRRRFLKQTASVLAAVTVKPDMLAEGLATAAGNQAKLLAGATLNDVVLEYIRKSSAPGFFSNMLCFEYFPKEMLRFNGLPKDATAKDFLYKDVFMDGDKALTFRDILAARHAEIEDIKNIVAHYGGPERFKTCCREQGINPDNIDMLMNELNPWQTTALPPELQGLPGESYLDHQGRIMREVEARYNDALRNALRERGINEEDFRRQQEELDKELRKPRDKRTSQPIEEHQLPAHFVSQNPTDDPWVKKTIRGYEGSRGGPDL